MKALYFAKESRKLRYGDNRSIVVGDSHEIEGRPDCCHHGLHASLRAIDALSYAPGCILYLVELSGDMDCGSDKTAATKRKYLAEFDATELLREFARKQAIINIEKAEQYFNSEEDFNLVLDWLNSGDKDLMESARSAAESAAWSAWSAAEAAAWSAAWSAAESAWSAAWSAWSAAESAAWSAAWSAWSAAESARSAAWSAAESAAESAANVMLCEMIEKETGWDLSFSKGED